jgi:hypothetical protein
LIPAIGRREFKLVPCHQTNAFHDPVRNFANALEKFVTQLGVIPPHSPSWEFGVNDGAMVISVKLTPPVAI